MEDWIRNEGLQHIPKKVFENLDLETLNKCRSVSKTWRNFIDHKVWESKFAEESKRRQKQAQMIFDIFFC